MLQYEFYGDVAEGAPMSSRTAPRAPKPQPRSERPYKFQLLLTSYETLRDDFALLGTIHWRCLVIDEVVSSHRTRQPWPHVTLAWQAMSTWPHVTPMLTSPGPM